MMLVNRKMQGLTPPNQIKGQAPRNQALPANSLCGNLMFKNTDGTYDYYTAQNNGCVYVYLLDQPGGSVVAGYPTNFQAGGTVD